MSIAGLVWMAGQAGHDGWRGGGLQCVAGRWFALGRGWVCVMMVGVAWHGVVCVVAKLLLDRGTGLRVWWE